MARRTQEVRAESYRRWCNFPREKKPKVGAFPEPAQQDFTIAVISLCPQKAREIGRVIVQLVTATNTLQALVTSDSAFMGPGLLFFSC